MFDLTKALLLAPPGSPTNLQTSSWGLLEKEAESLSGQLVQALDFFYLFFRVLVLLLMAMWLWGKLLTSLSFISLILPFRRKHKGWTL